MSKAKLHLSMLQVKHKYGLPRLDLLRAMLRRELVLFQVLTGLFDPASG
jgi:hypothetical protein